MLAMAFNFAKNYIEASNILTDNGSAACGTARNNTVGVAMDMQVVYSYELGASTSLTFPTTLSWNGNNVSAGIETTYESGYGAVGVQQNASSEKTASRTWFATKHRFCDDGTVIADLDTNGSGGGQRMENSGFHGCSPYSWYARASTTGQSGSGTIDIPKGGLLTFQWTGRVSSATPVMRNQTYYTKLRNINEGNNGVVTGYELCHGDANHSGDAEAARTIGDITGSAWESISCVFATFRPTWVT